MITNDEIKSRMMSILRRRDRLNRDMKELAELTDGEVDFPVIDEWFQMFKGVDKIAEIFGKTVTVKDRDDTDYPIEKSIMLNGTKVLMIE